MPLFIPGFARPVCASVLLLALMFSAISSFATQAAPPEDPPLLGFDRTDTASERALEARFDATLNGLVAP